MDSMFKQYLAWYHRERAKYGTNTAVLMQVGKFFEIYDRLDLTTNQTSTNIREIADLCSLNLSEAKDPQDTNLLKLCGGFPEQSLPKFESQLLEAGYTVVVVVQVKDNKDRVEERVIDHISSPGVFEERYTSVSRLVPAAEATADACLIGLLIEPNDKTSYHVGIAAIESQTGQTWSTETVMPFLQGQPNIDAIEPFFLLHPPAELVCWWDGPAEAAPTEARIRIWFRLRQSTVVHVRNEKPPKPQPDAIRAAYSMKTALQPYQVLGLERHPQAYRCLGATLEFVKEHIPSLLKRLRMNNHWIPQNRLRLGNAALEQLNIVSNNNECLLFWLQKTYTSPGRRALRARLVSPISEIDELKSRFSRIDFLRVQTNANLERHLRSIYDLTRLHRKVHLGTLSLVDLTHLLVTYSAIQDLMNELQETPCMTANLAEISAWFTARQSQWDAKRMATATCDMERTHPWCLGVHPELDEFEANWANLLTAAKTYASDLSEPNAPIMVVSGEHVPFEFTITRKRFERITANGAKLQFHPISAKSSAGTLESAEIQQFQKRAIQIKKGWDELQNRLWLEALDEWSLSSESLVNGQQITENITHWVANLDVDFTLARCANEYDLVTPTFVEAGTSAVSLTGLRHPIIERVHTASPYVKHDITIGHDGPSPSTAETGLLIYGTNASGKSSLMKAVGLAVISAQCGIPVAATTCTITPYKSLFTRILSNDNLWAALSSFAVEMTEFRGILKYADEHSLILGDELCSGTETRSATAIFSAGVQILAKRHAQFLFATHLHEITELPEIRALQGVKFAHLGVQYNTATRRIEYQRTLEAGSGSSLYGLEVCYGLDMDPEFLELANRTRTRVSNYNAAVVVAKCEVCQSTNQLETHHIQYQSAAKNGFVEPGVATHRASNLTVLCESCHTAHHNGLLLITGWRDTSEGRQLKWERVTAPAVASVAAPADDCFDMIKDDLRILISKHKKEAEMITRLSITTGRSVSTSELRKWKKRL